MTTKKTIKKATGKKVTYEFLWRNKFLTTEAKSIAEMAVILQHASQFLADIVLTGKVSLLMDGVANDYAYFVTDDAKVAAQFGFEKVEKE